MFERTRTPSWHRRFALAAFGALGLAAVGAGAQTFPAKPVTLVVPFAAGGSTDLVARVMGEALRKELGQMVVVDNRAGAGGMLGTEAVSRAKPDGYTIGVATVSTLAVNPVFYDKAVKANANLKPLIGLVTMPAIFTVNPAVPAKDFAGFIAEVKRKPAGSFSAAVPGIGSIGHLLIEAINESFGVKILAVPYRGMGPAQTDVIAGTAQVLFDQAPSVLQQVQGGKLTALAVAAEQRLPELPQVATLKEAGQPALNELGITWFALVVPAKTPAPVVDRLHAAAKAALQAPDTVARLTQMGAQVSATPGNVLQQQIDAALKRNREIAKRADIKVE
ncbi:MAG TPA: tripartite tricarboxylate transporter substrate-binding protein [Rubrivivax sp.]|nr:tripartite tricarboxylate transporter substrate-binding protein [Rubrivivax sp.]HPO19187.1 tripartite tricarboxylate transporter substrate-binding protein [Rubrivivax sp.]